MIPYGVATHGAVPLNSIQAVLHTTEIGSDQTVLGRTKHVPAIQKLQSTTEPPKPLARVLVDVLALDITNQTVTIGKPQKQPA